jgi:hypothetical protein
VKTSNTAHTKVVQYLTPEERQVVDSWRAFKKVCNSDAVKIHTENDVTPEIEHMPRMILYGDVSGSIEISWVEKDRRTRLTLGTLFEGGYIPEPEHTPHVWKRVK